MPKGAIASADAAAAATAAVRLREMVRELETASANVPGRGAGVVDLLKLRDAIEAEFARLQVEEGLDLRPERTRVETVDNILTRKTPQLARELAGVGGFAGARKEVNPPEEHWWWYLDLQLAEKQRRTAIRFSIIFVVAAVVLIGANFLLNRLSGLSPTEKEARGYAMQGDQFLQRGEYDKAIAEYERAVATVPTLAESQALLGVLYELRGDTEKSRAALAAAEAVIGNRPDYLLVLSRAYQDVGKLDVALKHAEEALKLNPASVQGYIIRGGIHEQLNNFGPALDDYDRAATLAQDQKQDALYVMAKMRLGMLMQRGPAPPTPTATPAK